MRSSTEYPMLTECHNCGQNFAEHCAADDACPAPRYRGMHGGWVAGQRFQNLFATPGNDPDCGCGHGFFAHGYLGKSCEECESCPAYTTPDNT
jgi:hypothetical protein